MPTPSPSLFQPAGMPAPQPQQQYRSFGDVPGLRDNIFNNALQSAQGIEPIQNDLYTLTLSDVRYDGPEKFSRADQKNAILTHGSLTRKMRGTWTLMDNKSQQPVATRTATIANVPYLTDSGTFVNKGVEYTLAHQLRLRPGIFTREKENGELESHVNALPGKGRSHRYYLDPKTGVFKIQIGQAQIPLMPLLKAMGVQDKQIRETWGNEIAAANMEKGDAGTIDKLYQRLVYKPKPGLDELAKIKEIATEFAKTEFDEEVTKRTLGKPYKNLTPDAILDITKKLIAVNRKEAESDDRDSMAYQQVYGPEDLIAERFVKDKSALRQLLWKATAKKTLDHIPVGVFNKGINAALIGSGLGSCFDAQTFVLTRRGFVAWPDVTDDDEFACNISGKLEYHKAYRIIRQPYAGELLGCRTKRLSYLVTPNHRLWCKAKPLTEYREERADDAFGRTRIFQTALPDIAASVDADFTLPAVVNARWKKQIPPAVIPGDLWAEFLGWYLAEGWVSDEPATEKSGRRMRVCLAQCAVSNPDGHANIVRVLSGLPFNWTYNASNKTFFITNKQLATELLKYGVGSRKKRIPRYCFDWSRRRLQLLANAYLCGDGNTYAGYVKAETVSEGLATDLVELFGRLDGTGRISKRKLSLVNSNWADSYVVSFGVGRESCATSDKETSRQGRPPTYYRQQYSGVVYCASVPGEKLYVLRDGKPHWSLNSLEEINPAEIFDHQTRVTRLGEGGIGSIDAIPAESRSVQPSHFGFIDYLRTPESSKVGVDMRFAAGARKSPSNIHTFVVPVKDVNTGKTVFKTPQELAEEPLVFPGEEKSDLPMLAALQNGKIKYVPRKDAKFMLPSMDNSLSMLSNMVPMKSMSKGHRVIMGSRMFTQALPLVDAESPHVQSAVNDEPDKSYEDKLGEHLGAVRATSPGVVESVTPDNIVYRDAEGKRQTIDLYNDMPFNRKTLWTQKPTVQPGDQIKPGQLLATSNFTDKDGTTALGKNLRVAYLPFRGKNYEDAVVISESAAKRLTSEHMYQHETEWDDNTHVGKKAFVSLFPSEYDKKMLEKFDDNGAIKKGTVVNYGDPLVLVAKKREQVYGKVHRGRGGNFSNETVTWDHHSPGIVTDVGVTKKGVNVVVKSQSQMEVGDKLSGRFGDKGVVSEIVPDHQMPQDKEGNPFEILVSPLGLISRINPSQVIEAALGKVAAKTGQKYKIKDFDSDTDLVEFAQRELAKHNLSDTEDLTDPETGRKIKGVLTGSRFYMKLHHTAESKGQGRSMGSYTAEGTPAKGGSEGAKRVGMLDLGALLSHGAGKVIRDAKMVRGQANPEYWTQFMAGYDPPLPKVPHVYEKFVNQLKAAGVNTVRTGTKTNIMALTDKDVDELAGDREIQSAETVDWKGNLKPKVGGLFDEKLTGGHNGNRWAKVTLHEAMPNPIMEEPIRRVLGLTEQKFRDVLAGREKFQDKTGPEAISAALARINVPRAIEQAREDIKSGRKTLRDAAVRRLGFLKGAETTGVHPQNWMLTKMPVLPPMFRPVSQIGAKKMQLVDDANYLYKELIDSNNVLKDATGVLADTGDERLALYDAMKGVSGLGDPLNPKHVEKNVRGYLRKIFGDSPKFGTVQRKLLSSTVDLVGRAVITPNPDLNMDEIALPEEKAWDIYKPFVVRGLVRRGMPRMQALQAIEEKNKAAFAELNTQMNSRPIVINRAPVLHRYGMMAFYPRLTKNKVLEVNPTITKGFGADFDGDAMQYHVPSTDDAAKEAIEKMLPSKNLFSVSTFKAHYVPTMDYHSGVYLASSRINQKAKPRVYRNKKDAIRAYRAGEIDVDTPVHIVEDKD